MVESYVFENPNFTDLNMFQWGMEDCTAGYFYGPAVRDHYLIHYILNGRGRYQVANQNFTVKKGQGFLICPHAVTSYQADPEDPWSYAWVGFNGLKAELYLKHAKLNCNHLLFSFQSPEFVRHCFENMLAAEALQTGREARLHGYLYVLLSQLLEEAGGGHFREESANIRELYLKKAIAYIGMNFSRKISVAEIAGYIGVDRSYLCRLFKGQLNLSPQAFMIHFRVDKACGLMTNPDLRIGDISRSVGYDDPLVFSKIFKKIKGASPKEYRRIAET